MVGKYKINQITDVLEWEGLMVEMSHSPSHPFFVKGKLQNKLNINLDVCFPSTLGCFYRMSPVLFPTSLYLRGRQWLKLKRFTCQQESENIALYIIRVLALYFREIQWKSFAFLCRS